MKETIRLAEARDVEELLAVYKEAREFMAQHGNPTQWYASGYPGEAVLEEDIALSRLYVIERGGRIAAAFVIAEGEEPTYRVIEEGEWPTSRPYLTVHRLASRTDEHGCADAALEHAERTAASRGMTVRADTHADNAPMRRILERRGYRYCGVIRVRGGSPRLAFELRE
ncbi:MAG: N-acetyltransferase [Clostridia bacterium]|nr:N-acetyltransferase [Clostridia bacterium]